jgi:ParB/RepB/Spo0J family partition protein
MSEAQAAAIASASKNLELVERKRLHPSPWNRQHINEAKIEEIAQSMRDRVARGLIATQQAIKARPHPEHKLRADGGLEIVYGHCREKGAELAEVDVLLCEVVDLTDEQVLEEQALENSGRQDTHPLDEAMQYERLTQKPFDWSLQMIADKFGTTISTIHARRKLLALAPSVRKMYLADRFNASIALYLARIPNKELQERAAKEITDVPKLDQWETQEGAVAEPMSARAAFAHIQKHYMLTLADAPFDVTDETLTKAGSCEKCPKRTGNQVELFSDVKSTDVCTDPACYEDKENAMWARRVAGAQADGNKVLSETATKKLFPFDHDPTRMSYESEFVDLDGRCPDDSKQRTYRQVLKAKPPKVTLARDRVGNIRELLKKDEVKQAYKDAGVTFEKAQLASSKKKKSAKEIESDKQQREQVVKEKEKRTVRTVAWNAIAAQLVAAVEKKTPDKGFWRSLVDQMLDVSYDAEESLCDRREVEGIDALPLDKMSEGELRGLVFEYVALGEHRDGYINGFDTKELKRLCDLYKVDVKAIEKEAVRKLGEVVSQVENGGTITHATGCDRAKWKFKIDGAGFLSYSPTGSWTATNAGSSNVRTCPGCKAPHVEAKPAAKKKAK